MNITSYDFGDMAAKINGINYNEKYYKVKDRIIDTLEVQKRWNSQS